MDRDNDTFAEDLLAAAQEAAKETEELVAQVRELVDKRDAELVDSTVELGRALRKGHRDQGARELRTALQEHAAHDARAAVESLDQLAAEDPWWSEGED